MSRYSPDIIGTWNLAKTISVLPQSFVELSITTNNARDHIRIFLGIFLVVDIVIYKFFSTKMSKCQRIAR